MLEVGCSNGRWLKWFNEEYRCKVYGVDLDSSGFAPNDVVDFQIGDALNLPHRDEYFDVVFSLGLIEHFKKNDKYRILKEQKRVLKRGGYLICQVPLLSFSLNFLYVKIFYDFKKGFKHFRTTENELKKYFQKLNFDFITMKHLGCILSGSFWQQAAKYKLFKKILATEILIIARKIN